MRTDGKDARTEEKEDYCSTVVIVAACLAHFLGRQSASANQFLINY